MTEARSQAKECCRRRMDGGEEIEGDKLQQEKMRTVSWRRLPEGVCWRLKLRSFSKLMER
jgi:hypothetical protein